MEIKDVVKQIDTVVAIGVGAIATLVVLTAIVLPSKR
ncbi:hypothetical protein ST201phi2-1p388 [Pseudomonas phage 201phi2-1]|uniref:Uncharacterized protein n=1 Tax=Pseudomonas phage 201phi2-1 TaxID=198110 RepID=B3FJP8_BP201|nr:hypothetical protein ST201phi2-1p388 [Pseudomonas phage 201phi2-1]ABY63213.1 hypothetical protein 201phi2-1p388 [Pseudomonas phage 201phi2-1]